MPSVALLELRSDHWPGSRQFVRFGESRRLPVGEERRGGRRRAGWNKRDGAWRWHVDAVFPEQEQLELIADAGFDRGGRAGVVRVAESV